MVRFLRRSKNDYDGEQNFIPTGHAAAAATAAPSGPDNAKALESPVDKKDKSGGGLFRKKATAAKKEKVKIPPIATRDKFSMASWSTWTTKATELHRHGLLGDDQTDAAGNPSTGNPTSPRRSGRDKRDDGDDDAEVQRGGGRATRFKPKSSLLERNKTDDTNIAVIYSSYGDQASKVMNLVLRDDLPVPKGPLDVIVQVDVSTTKLLIQYAFFMCPHVIKTYVYRISTNIFSKPLYTVIPTVT